GTREALAERLALEAFHDQEGGAFRRDTVIEDRYRTAVLDLVRRVSLLQKSRDDRGIGGQLRPQHLDRDPLAVSVCRREDLRHSPDAEDALECPFASEHGAEPSFRVGAREHLGERAELTVPAAWRGLGLRKREGSRAETPELCDQAPAAEARGEV